MVAITLHAEWNNFYWPNDWSSVTALSIISKYPTVDSVAKGEDGTDAFYARGDPVEMDFLITPGEKAWIFVTLGALDFDMDYTATPIPPVEEDNTYLYIMAAAAGLVVLFLFLR